MCDFPRGIIAGTLLALAIWQAGTAGVIYAKAWLAPLLIGQAWENSVASGGNAVYPWPWADTWPVARLQMPVLEVDQYVLAGGGGSVLAFGPGHVSASAALGSGGRVVIGGHRDTHFSFLRHLKRGDEFSLQLSDGLARRYRVAELAIVDSERQGLLPDARQDELLLVTCYPFGAIRPGGPLRFVVTARPEPSAYRSHIANSNNTAILL